MADYIPTLNKVNELIDEAIEDQPAPTVSIPATAYASNADAVAALGVGKLYKSTNTIGPQGDSSPIILITV